METEFEMRDRTSRYRRMRASFLNDERTLNAIDEEIRRLERQADELARGQSKDED
jgi:hypothetical protein